MNGDQYEDEVREPREQEQVIFFHQKLLQVRVCFYAFLVLELLTVSTIFDANFIKNINVLWILMIVLQFIVLGVVIPVQKRIPYKSLTINGFCGSLLLTILRLNNPDSILINQMANVLTSMFWFFGVYFQALKMAREAELDDRRVGIDAYDQNLNDTARELAHDAHFISNQVKSAEYEMSRMEQGQIQHD
jgi:hypothetical protein